MRLLSALALTVVAVLVAVFSSCESGNVAPTTLDGGFGSNPRNPNDAFMPPGDIFVPIDAPALQFDGSTIGQPDALF